VLLEISGIAGRLGDLDARGAGRRRRVTALINTLVPDFMLGGSDFVITSRTPIGHPGVRDLLRRQRLTIACFPVTDAISHADAGRAAAIVRHDSCWREDAGEWSLPAR
jgi:hypothetical protein